MTVARAVALAAVAGAAGAGEAYVALADLAPAWGMTVTAASRKAVELRSRWTALLFTPETRQARVNGTLIWLNDTVREVQGKWSINTIDRAKSIEPILVPSRHLAGVSATVVLLDPGHGGDDPGAIARNGLAEKQLTLDLARRVRVHLANAGIRAVLTRETDRAVSLDQRVAMIRRSGANVFVSLHFNAATSTSMYGVETFALTPMGYSSTAGGDSASRRVQRLTGHAFDAANLYLAYQIQRSLRLWMGTSHDRGVRRARFAVLRDATCPAVLVEAGFLSHSPTAQRLASSAYLDTLAQRIALGIAEYVKAARAAKSAARPPAAASSGASAARPR